jgi:nucleotide-binding universal stress UspA family protein
MKAQPAVGRRQADRGGQDWHRGLVVRALRGQTLGTKDHEPWTIRPTPGPEPAGGDPGRTKVLVPYSASTAADAALGVAADLSKALPAEVWVLYVRAWDPVRGGRIFLETEGEAHAVAAAAVQRLRRLGVSAKARVREASRGRIADAIIAEGEDLGAHSIVLGTHARGPFATAFRGSTSLSVARRATRPVLLVKVPMMRPPFWRLLWGPAR